MYSNQWDSGQHLNVRLTCGTNVTPHLSYGNARHIRKFSEDSYRRDQEWVSFSIFGTVFALGKREKGLDQTLGETFGECERFIVLFIEKYTICNSSISRLIRRHSGSGHRTTLALSQTASGSHTRGTSLPAALKVSINNRVSFYTPSPKKNRSSLNIVLNTLLSLT